MKSVPLRVLHILNNLGSGGAESMLMNLYRTIDKSKVQFDFMVRSTGDNRLVDEIERLGGHVYIMPDFPRKAVSNYLAVDAFFAEHKEYKIIHVHANALIYVFPLILAKKHKIPCRILHSHNTNTCGGMLGRMIHWVNRQLLDRWVTDYLACSDRAARWMFGHRPYTQVNNGIELDAYRYSPEARQRMRAQLGVQHESVIGHVGRFLPVKNHPFIIEIFAELLKQNPDAKLLLIGEGEMTSATRGRINALNLQDRIILTGVVSNVHEYMSAMDAFIFPSFYEGLPLALVEAQANGLPCVISDRIPAASVLTDEVQVLSLSASPAIWAAALRSSLQVPRRSNLPDSLYAFDNQKTVLQLTQFYEEKAGKRH